MKDNSSENISCTDEDFKATLEVVGGQIPTGNVRVSGAKNAATKLMAASLLTAETVHLDNFPTELLDARSKAAFLTELGVCVDFDREADAVEICARNISPDGLKHY